MNDDLAVTVAALRAEVAALRAELEALRVALAVEIRTGRLLVDDGIRRVEVTPGRVEAVDDRTRSFAYLEVDDAWSSVAAVVDGHDEVSQSASVSASSTTRWSQVVVNGRVVGDG